MAPPRQFRHLVKAMTRGPLSERETVPIRLGNLVVDTTPDGRPLRAVVTQQTVEMEIAGRQDYVTRTVVTYAIADLPRKPRRGDHVVLDGVEKSVAVPFDYRAGNVDCVLVD